MKTFGSAVFILSSVLKLFPWLPEMLDFRLSLQTGNSALTSELKQPFLMDWKKERFMTSQPTTLSRSVKYGVHFGAEGQWSAEIRHQKILQKHLETQSHISFSLVMQEYSFPCFSLSSWGLSAIWEGWFILALGCNLGLTYKERGNSANTYACFMFHWKTGIALKYWSKTCKKYFFYPYSEHVFKLFSAAMEEIKLLEKQEKREWKEGRRKENEKEVKYPSKPLIPGIKALRRT